MDIQRQQAPFLNPPRNQIHQYRPPTDNQLPQVTIARQQGQASNPNPGVSAMRSALRPHWYGGAFGFNPNQGVNDMSSAMSRYNRMQGNAPGFNPNQGVNAMRSAISNPVQQAGGFTGPRSLMRRV